MHDETQSPADPNEEEMRAALEEQMRQLRVDDVILQTVVTLVNLAGRRLGLGAEPGEDLSGEHDLGQARTAIDAVRALTPFVASDQAEALREAVSQLQMAYAQAAGGPPPSGAGAESAQAGEGPPAAGGQAERERDEEAGKAAAEKIERAKARAKIWTPGSSN